jgi:tripartite-type tricarboxylate transporter receptor subunit TctC
LITRRNFVFGMVAVGSGLKIRGALAQDFPKRPVTLIVPLPGGTGADAAMRTLAAATESHLGQPVVIENKPGGSTTLAPAQMARIANPDGYTLAQITQVIFREPFLRKTSYDPAQDFTYVIAVGDTPLGVVVRSDAPWRSFAEFVSHAKANPNKITYGSVGVGTSGNIVMEHIAKRQGIKWVHVPFNGVDDVNALLGGHIDALANPSTWAPQVNAGQFRLLVTFGASRTRNWPTVPTLTEAGIELVMNSPYGIAGPRGMNPNIVKVLHDAFRKGMEHPSFAAMLAKFGQEQFYLNSSDYREFALTQIAQEKGLGIEDR